MAVGFSGVLTRWIQTVKPHVPMIKFRKGGHNLSGAGHSSQSETLKASSASQSIRASNHVTSRPIIEDYQLPLRYKRQPLDQQEIDAINSGGAYF